MQLHKQAISKTATFNPAKREEEQKNTVRRQPSDYNQTNNHSKSVKQSGDHPKRGPKPLTPRESFALEAARGNHNNRDPKHGKVGGDGELPSIAFYNSQVRSNSLTGPLLMGELGTNW